MIFLLFGADSQLSSTVFYLKETFAAFTRADPIVLTGCIITTNGTVALTGPCIVGFRRSHSPLCYPGTFQRSMFQGHGGAMKWRNMLLRGQEERVFLAWLSVQVLPQWGVFLQCGPKGEKGELLAHGRLISYGGQGGWVEGAERRIPDRGRLGLKAWCWRSRSINWTAIIVRATGWQSFIKAAECKGAWVTAIHLEIVQLDTLVLYLRAGTLRYCGVVKWNWRGRRSRGNLAGISIKLARKAVSHQGVDAGQRRRRQLVLLAADVHDQFGTEVRVQELRAEAGVMGHGCILGLYTGHRWNREQQLLLVKINPRYCPCQINNVYTIINIIHEIWADTFLCVQMLCKQQSYIDCLVTLFLKSKQGSFYILVVLVHAT